MNRLKQQFQRYSLEIAFCLLLIAANVFFYGYQQQLKQQQISALLGQPLPLVVLGDEIWLNPLTAEEPNPRTSQFNRQSIYSGHNPYK